jgi:hypothetical protein
VQGEGCRDLGLLSLPRPFPPIPSSNSFFFFFFWRYWGLNSGPCAMPPALQISLFSCGSESASCMEEGGLAEKAKHEQSGLSSSDSRPQGLSLCHFRLWLPQGGLASPAGSRDPAGSNIIHSWVPMWVRRGFSATFPTPAHVLWFYPTSSSQESFLSNHP